MRASQDQRADPAGTGPAAVLALFLGHPGICPKTAVPAKSGRRGRLGGSAPRAYLRRLAEGFRA
jgi:hypothetical protein